MFGYTRVELYGGYEIYENKDGFTSTFDIRRQGYLVKRGIETLSEARTEIENF